MVALQPGLRIDRYEVVRPLGQGGMAVVVEVRHLDLGTRHALKVLQIQAPWLYDRLLAEGRIQARLRDSHVCRVTDVIRVGEAPGLVMELVEGPPLDLLMAHYQPNLDQIDHLARGILAGVRAAHAADLVHRDLKPANILLEIADEQVIPKVVDYGLAKSLADLESGTSTTRSGATLGTPSYMAPEQFRNAKHADQRADLFSVGCILYELVSGMRPFPGETPIEVYEASSQGRFRPLRDVAPNVPGRMADAITRALAPKPDGRFQSCVAFLEAWCGDVGDDKLARAWEPQHLELVRSLLRKTARGDGLVHSTASIGNGPETFAAPPKVSPTAVPELGSSSVPSVPSRRTREPSRPAGAPEMRSALVTQWSRPGLAGVAGLSVLGLVSGLGLALLLGVLLVAGLWWSRTELGRAPSDVAVAEPSPVVPLPAPTEVTPAEPVEPERVEPDLADPDLARPTPVPVVPSPAPLPAPQPAVEPEPSLPPAPVPALADPNAATVSIVGVERAWLIGKEGRFKPGSVPAGEYKVQVFFEPDKARQVLVLRLGPGEQRVIQCNPLFKVCE